MTGPKYPPLNPAFSYFGAKWSLVRDRRYPAPLYPLIIEPFAGSACYSLHFHRHEVVLVDINPTIIDIWGAVKSADETLYDLPDDFECVPPNLDPGLQALIGHWVAHGNSTPRTKPTSWARRHPDGLWWGPKVKTRLIAQAPHLRHWHACTASYRSLPNVEATWFIDPPYQCQPNSYACPPVDYEDLADFVRSRRGQVIVCEGGHADWLPFVPIAPGRKKTSGKKGDIGLDERLWYRVPSHPGFV